MHHIYIYICTNTNLKMSHLIIPLITQWPPKTFIYHLLLRWGVHFNMSLENTCFLSIDEIIF